MQSLSISIILLLTLCGIRIAHAVSCPGACGVLQRQLGATAVVTPEHVRPLREWLGRAVVQAHGAQQLRASGTLLARGYAQLMAGAVGEGIQTLLRAAEPHASHAALDGAYLGVLILWPELTPTQQVDWARDLAGRYALVAVGERPQPNGAPPIRLRPLDLQRLIWLYTSAQEPRAVQHFTQLGQRWFPEDPAFARQATPSPRVVAERPTPQATAPHRDRRDW
ncbi:MAG: hypothetical protein HY696_02480 [Deltaproteobacteria bacterium]|nr:hypothetical protein [Deltaproteobacteria bacterium]